MAFANRGYRRQDGNGYSDHEADADFYSVTFSRLHHAIVMW